MQNNYKKSILRILKKSNQPIDVEKIRVACNIGNWLTALNHCLELHHDEIIEGTKTTKSWVFWINATKRSIRKSSAQKKGGE